MGPSGILGTYWRDKNYLVVMIKPGRGHWDRSLSRGQRRARERAGIVRAAARAHAEFGRALTLTHVVLEAGVGRNTFYDHFEDVDAAVVAAEEEGALVSYGALVAAGARARTPVERVRAVSRAWVAFAAEHRDLVSALCRRTMNSPLRPVGVPGLESILAEVLSEARAAGAVGREPEPLRVRGVAAAFLAAAMLIARAEPILPEETAEMLSDLVLRAFR
jgi:AcrR family transcriptional regulator